MRALFAAVLFTGTVAGFSGVNAADGCGPGCHAAPSGACRSYAGATDGGCYYLGFDPTTSSIGDTDGSPNNKRPAARRS
jgi:hypothetical protein